MRAGVLKNYTAESILVFLNQAPRNDVAVTHCLHLPSTEVVTRWEHTWVKHTWVTGACMRACVQAGGPHLVHIVLVEQGVIEGVEGVEEVHDRHRAHLLTHISEATNVREQERDLQAVVGSTHLGEATDIRQQDRDLQAVAGSTIHLTYRQ